MCDLIDRAFPGDGQLPILEEEVHFAAVLFTDYDQAIKTPCLTRVKASLTQIYNPVDPVAGEIRLVAVMPAKPNDPTRVELEVETRDC